MNVRNIGMKKEKPLVLYKELPSDQVLGRDFFQVVESRSEYWKAGDTFSDDDMSMGSTQVKFESVR